MDDDPVEPLAFAELLERVRTLTRAGTAPARGREIPGPLPISPSDLPVRQATRGGRHTELTAKEFALLELLPRRQAEVLPRSLFAIEVWDMNCDSDMNVIDVAVYRLRAKIDDGFEPQLILSVCEVPMLEALADR